MKKKYFLVISMIFVAWINVIGQDTIFIKDSKRVNIKSECKFYLVLNKIDSLNYRITERDHIDTLLSTYTYRSEAPIYVSTANLFKLINAKYLQLHGDFCVYNNGELERITQYNQGQQVSDTTFYYKKYYNYEEVDEIPFPLRVDKESDLSLDKIHHFRLHIQRRLRYPEDELDEQKSGEVLVSFIINRHGELSQIRIIEGQVESLNNEVIRVLKTSPKWQPGQKDGVPVNVIFKIRIIFTGVGPIVIGEWEK